MIKFIAVGSEGGTKYVGTGETPEAAIEDLKNNEFYGEDSDITIYEAGRSGSVVTTATVSWGE